MREMMAVVREACQLLFLSSLEPVSLCFDCTGKVQPKLPEGSLEKAITDRGPVFIDEPCMAPENRMCHHEGANERDLSRGVQPNIISYNAAVAWWQLVVLADKRPS